MVAPQTSEYLVSLGAAGELGLFAALGPLDCARGDQVVVRGGRGLEIGIVLCAATPRHARLLQTVGTGELLRRAAAADLEASAHARARGQGLFEECRALAADLELPFEALDVEFSLDGRQATVQFLGAPGCPVDALAATLARRHDVFVRMHNLAAEQEAAAGEEETAGCGEPNCGKTNGGGCTSCGTEGGCGTGCGSSAPDMTQYFAHLRGKMEQRAFTPLL